MGPKRFLTHGDRYWSRNCTGISLGLSCPVFLPVPTVWRFRTGEDGPVAEYDDNGRGFRICIRYFARFLPWPHFQMFRYSWCSFRYPQREALVFCYILWIGWTVHGRLQLWRGDTLWRTYFAHLGGMLFGLFYGSLLEKKDAGNGSIFTNLKIRFGQEIYWQASYI